MIRGMRPRSLIIASTAALIVIALSAVALSASVSENVTSGWDSLESPKAQVQSLRVLILSTMLADAGIGEWGFAALVEADGHRLLFDTGRHPDTVLRNARDLGVNLSDVTDVVLSHHHGDHTGGLFTLRQELSKGNADAISKVHVVGAANCPRL